MSLLLTMGIVLTKYLNGAFQTEKIKEIFEFIKCDYDRLKNSPEFTILSARGAHGRKFNIYFSIVFTTLLMVYLSAVTTLIILGNMNMRNESDTRVITYQAEYHVDINDYYYLKTFHDYYLTILNIFLLIALDTMYLVFTEHACALFEITGYRLRTAHILDLSVLKNEEELEKYNSNGFTAAEKRQIHRKVIRCVKEHKRALEYTDLVQSTYSVALFIQIALSIVCMSVTGVQCLLKMGILEDMVRLGIWTVGEVLHLFSLCLPGQRLMDFSEQVYYDALECMWYILSTKSQLTYQFLVMNSIKPCQITALKVTALTLETFLSVIQAAMSYFTVLASTL